MEKKNLKRLLISILTIIFSLVLYMCLPFLINFDIEKKAKIETLFSDTIRYQVSIKGSIKYKLNPLPTLEISEIHLTKKNENSIVNKIEVNISIFDLLKNKYFYKKIIFHGGEFIVDLDSLNDVYYNNNFQNKKIIFKELNLKFFSDTKSFNLDQLNSKILYNDRKINEIIANAFIGEIPFKINYKNDQLDLSSKNIGLNINLKNLSNKKKDLKFSFNRKSIFPGIDEIFASFKIEIDENNLLIETNKFKTNLFDGNITIKKSNETKNVIVMTGSFEKANLKKIFYKDLKIFLENDLNKLANILDAKISLSFNEIKTQKNLFDNAKFDFTFRKGDVIFKAIKLSSNKAKINIKGRNIKYQKDNLFFYDIIFETDSLKEMCNIICENESHNNKINKNKMRFYSKGILNINKAKVVVQEHNFIKQYNDNEIKKLNENLNNKVILGKLENLLDLSKYFNLL